MTVTGNHLQGSPKRIEDRGDDLGWLHARIFGDKSQGPTGPEASSDQFPPEDQAILAKARTAKNGQKFSQLWEGAWEEAGYPSQSEADLALCRMLAYWVNGDEETVDRLFRASGLYRDKWDEDHGGESYGARTVRKALQALAEDGSMAAPCARFVLPTKTAKELSQSVPPETPWLVRPWIAVGAITEVSGPVKLAGKTTWLSHLVAAKLDGRPFMEEPTQAGPVLWLTEQTEATFRPVLARAGLLEREDLHIVSWSSVHGRSWPEVVEAAIEKARAVGAKLLIIDTLGQFAGVEDENSASEALAALKPLQIATAEGFAAVVVRHERKSGGRVGEAGRGSTAFAGAVDVLVSLGRPDGEHRPTVRRIAAVSRFDGVPDQIFIDLGADGYKRLGTASDYAREGARGQILAALATAPEPSLTEKELRLCIRGSKRGTIQAALAGLAKEGKVLKVGRGVKGDPTKYSLAAEQCGPSGAVAA